MHNLMLDVNVMKNEHSDKMEELFETWKGRYPVEQRAGFHKDGVIEVESYLREPRKILFVMLEPNSTDGAYDHFFGQDLRYVYGQITPVKGLTRNVALWARAILDGNDQYVVLGKKEIRTQLRRVAIINLKKTSGTGKANLERISIFAWNDREFIKKQVGIISPDIIVTCGESSNKIFWWIVQNNLFSNPSDKTYIFNDMHVIPANHPSLRPRKNEEMALKKVSIMAREAGLQIGT